jgi:diamine N-acetyltransferase
VDVTLREITEANRPEVELLAVSADQVNYVDGVADSLAEAANTPAACPWYRAVYRAETPVGFVMITDGAPDGPAQFLGPYYLWRLLIDSRWQGRGLGAAALDLVVDYLRSRPGAETLLTSVVLGPGSPIGFYLRYGFTRTGQLLDREHVLELNLQDTVPRILPSTTDAPQA